ncbi:MAG: VIT1/CCC1 transporter family protein [Nitrospinae bacterium]|nr:VIT1/CCC1 transporter family protein [Nitrospinota bacterium]
MSDIMDYLKKFHDEDWHTPKGRVIREVIFGINETREIAEMPANETQEIREIYGNHGFKEDEIEMIDKRVTSDKKLWVRFMMREELGIVEESFDDPLRVGAIMGVSFAIGSLPPLIPYMVIDNPMSALKLAVIVSLIFLFCVGAGKTTVTKGSWLKSGIEVVIIGSIASGVGFVIGKIVSLVV